MTDIKLVIFDCDGVLVDSEIIATRLECKIYGDLGFKIDEMEFSERFAGMTSAEIKAVVEDELGYDLPDYLLNEIETQLDDQLSQNVEMIAGADKVANQLQIPKCICSNSTQSRLDITLSKTGLKKQFEGNILSSRDLNPPMPKPAPDVFLKAMAERGVEPRETVVIEDSTHGVHGGVAAGCRVVGFTGASHTWPSHGDALTDAGAETVIRRLVDLPDVVAAMALWDGIA